MPDLKLFRIGVCAKDSKRDSEDYAVCAVGPSEAGVLLIDLFGNDHWWLEMTAREVNQLPIMPTRACVLGRWRDVSPVEPDAKEQPRRDPDLG